MFVQTHFQRNRHQSASAQSTSQPNTGHKASKCTIPHSRSSNKNGAHSRICKPAVSQDIVIDRRIKVKNLIHLERESSSQQTTDFCSKTSLESHTPEANHRIQNSQSDPYKCHLDCCRLPPPGDCLAKDPPIVPNEDGNDDDDTKRSILISHDSYLKRDSYSTCHFCMLVNQADGDNLRSNDTILAGFSTMLDNLAQSVILIGRALIGKISTADYAQRSRKQDGTHGELSFVSKTMRAHLDLVISFSANLVFYQLETWRLLLDDDDLATKSTEQSLSTSLKTDDNFPSNSDFDHRSMGNFRSASLSQRQESSAGEYEILTTFKHHHQQQIVNHEFMNRTIQQQKSPETILTEAAHFASDHHPPGSTRRHVARSQVHGGTHAMTINDSCFESANLFNENHNYIGFNCDSKFPTPNKPPVDNRREHGGLHGSGESKASQILKQDSQTRTDFSVSSRTVSEETHTTHDNTNGVTSKKNSRRLSLTGTKGRIWFLQKRLASRMSVRRSEEVLPDGSKHLSASNSLSADKCAPPAQKMDQSQSGPTTSERIFDARMDFVGGLGIGQIVSRHALVSPVAGEIQLYLTDTRGILEVAVLQARGIYIKEADKDLSSTYVKVYLMRNKKCIAKYKTKPAPKTTDPYYHQKFIYREGHGNCIVQVIVWGESGRKNKKCLLGAAQLQLDELSASRSIISWYKLFDVPSMAGPLISSRSLRQRLLSIAPEVEGN